MTERRFDIILFGATGFTGKLVAGYLATKKPLRWAIAGRDRDKLGQLRAQLGAPELDILVADALDAAAVAAVARQTRVVCTTAGPYAKYGSAIVAACADVGTHYCDLTGEVQWMRQMIDAHHERARATGARIVHACGFDSIPSDMGTWGLQQEMIARHGAPATTVTAVYGELKGGFSGGTAASALGTAEAADDPAIRDLLANPYSLDPDLGASRPPVPSDRSIGWNRRLHMFTVPFVMAPLNTRVVRRGHALAGYPWGDDFIYREVMSTPGNARGLAMAVGVTTAITGFALAVKNRRLRPLIQRRAPKPGEGPPPEVRAAGHWKVRLVGEREGEALVYIAADRADPGYGSTCKMLGESALCLALDPLTSSGGVTTPSVAMGGALLARLRGAGLSFEPDVR
ncbi:MAG TPA: saccharopine dehydrogenase NADP-binding domain-containing protein [Kofleriaceae bacterium]|jgi:short subunit dehydrogenase-like uncharacterized protein|nr:saccharopine dehydrogenase NADP-binding domain-containing protein [Kofleriaceae bacterium]